MLLIQLWALWNTKSCSKVNIMKYWHLFNSKYFAIRNYSITYIKTEWHKTPVKQQQAWICLCCATSRVSLIATFVTWTYVAWISPLLNNNHKAFQLCELEIWSVGLLLNNNHFHTIHCTPVVLLDCYLQK